jgi:predicted NBD/HSP70 family sugar kinase
MGRSTVSQRMDALLAQELIVPAGDRASTGGRPPKAFAFNRAAGVALAADLGATHARAAITDLGGETLAETAADVAIADGPELVLGWLEQTTDRLLKEAGKGRRDLRAMGLGLPGPMEHATGTPVAPPIMPGWDGYPVSRRLRDRYQVPALVDNDVNIMAIGEHWASGRRADHLVFVKVGTGIGAGIIANGRIHRGAQGAAGDIGHVYVAEHADVQCRCGNYGCLEAVAGGAAMAARLRASGIEARDSRDVVRLVREGSPEAVRLVRQAGRDLGNVLAGLVNFFNPSVLVVGGDVAHADEYLLAGVREIVYRRSTALATRRIEITRSGLDDRAGVVGAAVMAIDHVLQPALVDRALAAAG